MTAPQLYISDLPDSVNGHPLKTGTSTGAARAASDEQDVPPRTIDEEVDDPTTLAIGEEGLSGEEPTTLAIGEEGDGDEPTTLAIGEEGDDDVTTLAVGEEAGAY